MFRLPHPSQKKGLILVSTCVARLLALQGLGFQQGASKYHCAHVLSATLSSQRRRQYRFQGRLCCRQLQSGARGADYSNHRAEGYCLLNSKPPCDLSKSVQQLCNNLQLLCMPRFCLWPTCQSGKPVEDMIPEANGQQRSPRAT